MSPDEFLVVNEERQKIREINGEQPEYVNFNNAATKFLLDQVHKIISCEGLLYLGLFMYVEMSFVELLHHNIIFSETKKEVFSGGYENRV